MAPNKKKAEKDDQIMLRTSHFPKLEINLAKTDDGADPIDLLLGNNHSDLADKNDFGERKIVFRFRRSTGEITISEVRGIGGMDDYQKAIEFPHDSFGLLQNGRFTNNRSTWCMVIRTNKPIVVDSSLDRQGSKVTRAAKGKNTRAEGSARKTMRSILQLGKHEAVLQDAAYHFVRVLVPDCDGSGQVKIDDFTTIFQNLSVLHLDRQYIYLDRWQRFQRGVVLQSHQRVCWVVRL